MDILHTWEFVKRYDTAVLASIGLNKGVMAVPIHYAIDDNRTLIFKSRATSLHVQGFLEYSSCALAIYRHESTFELKSGVQMQGYISRIRSAAEMVRCVEIYSNRFDGAREKFDPIDVLIRDNAPSTLFRFEPDTFKMTDNWINRIDGSYRSWRE